MTGPTSSCDRTSKLPRLARLRLSTTSRAPASRLVPSSAVVTSGRRISHSWFAASPNGWTIFSPCTESSARRTASSLTACSNLTTTSVPPEKSMPSGSPFLPIIAAPARITSSDSAMACQRQRMKSKLGFLRNSIELVLDAELRDVAAPRQRELEHRARHEDGGEHVGQQADGQRRGEAADRPGAELEEERRRDERGHVRIENREEDAIEASRHGLFDALGRRQLLLDALEDQHVRVDAHTDRENETGDTRQRHHRAEIRHQPEQDDQV